MPCPPSLMNLNPDDLCYPTRGKWLRQSRLDLCWTQKELAGICGVARTTIVRWEQDHFPTPKWVIILVYLAFICREWGDHFVQHFVWSEKERNQWRIFLSSPNSIFGDFQQLRKLLDVPTPPVPTKTALLKKYKRQVRYAREKEGSQR